MADRYIKTEKINASSMLPGPSLIPDPKWRTATPDSNLKRVLLKEAAATHGSVALKALLLVLKKHVTLNPSCQSRIEKIEGILSRKKNFQVYVGFIGASGAGKSTLINAIIGFPKLLPSSAERACTAVPVEVSFNTSDDINAKFRAEVVYFSQDEWRVELEQFFADIAAQENAKNDGDDDGADEERQDRIKIFVDKIKFVYSEFSTRTLEKLKASNVEALLMHSALKGVIGCSKEIRKSNRAELAGSLLAHVDSGDSSEGTAFWPLIKLVKVFVKSSVLEHGLTLVDLPGTGDSNAARSSVADSYQKQLAVTVILSDARRALSEKTAHDLLEKVTKKNLQLDGLYNSKSLCFVISQIDRDFDVHEYLDSHQKLKVQHDEDLKVMHTAGEKIVLLTEERYAVTMANQENCKLAKQQMAELKDIKKRLDASPANTGIRREFSEKQSSLLDLQNLIIKEKKVIESLSRRIESNRVAKFHACSRMRQACIWNRNNSAKEVIRKDYEETLAQMGRSATESLGVFCVAATLYLRYKNTGERAPGFPNREDTGVQELRDWLVATTFDSREEIAQAFLHEIEAFLDSNASWIYDKYGELKMTAELREIWEPQLVAKFTELEKKFSQLEIMTAKTLEQLIQSSLYTKIPDATRVAAMGAMDIAAGFSNGLHWSTHRSVNRNYGHWNDSRKRKHRWNDKLAVLLKDAVVPDWNKTFQEEIPVEQESYINDGKKLISDFAEIAAQDNISADVSSALTALQDLITRNTELFETLSKNSFKEITKAYRQSHRTIPSAIKTFLKPMYDECGSAYGLGHYRANRALHRKWMKDKGLAMYLEASGAAMAVLNGMVEKLSKSLRAANNIPLKDIQEQITRFFDENTASGTRTSGRKVVSNIKLNMQKDLLPILAKLTEAWTSDVGVEKAVEEEDDDNYVLFDNNDLFHISGKDSSDADYEDGSDLEGP